MSELKYRRILRAAWSVPWAILPARLADIFEVLIYQANGGKLSAEEVREYAGVAAQRPQRVVQTGNGVAIIGVRGLLSHRAEQVDNISGPGGTSVERFRQRFRDAMNSSQVSAVVLDVDSPGGSVEGIEEMAGEIFEARGVKPIVAVANTLAASAAYYLASQADEVVVTPSGEVGSIGVFAAHEDVSEALATEGRHITLVSAGKFKTEGNPFEPLSDEARSTIQSAVDRHYAAFVSAVARGRGVKTSAVRGGFGEGRLLGASDAVSEGMADRVATLDETVQRLQTKGGAATRRRAGPADPAEFEFLAADAV